MQAREITCADGMQKRGRSPGEIVAKLQRGCSPKRKRGPSKTAVYRFLSGSAYVRGQSEARGRKSMLPRGILGPSYQSSIRLAFAQDSNAYCNQGSDSLHC